MLTCPWCGTNYAAFQSNCANCGGPLPLPAQVPPEADALLASPPLPPRPFSNSYAWRLLLADGAVIAAFVFIVLGLVFTSVGVVLTVALGPVFTVVRGVFTVGKATAFVGVPFAVIGPLFLIVAVALGVWRYGKARQVVRVLREGQAIEGEIIEVGQNYNVRINYQHPWVIWYQFRVDGRDFEGRVTTLNPPGAHLQEGKRAWVLYLPNALEQNVLYPHP